MIDLLDLYLTIVALYAMDSLYLAPAGALLLRRGPWGSWKAGRPELPFAFPFGENALVPGSFLPSSGFLIGKIPSLDEDEKEARKGLRACLDADAARADYERLRALFRHERALNLALASFLLVVFPVAVILLHFALQWWQVLAILAALVASVTALNFRNTGRAGARSLAVTFGYLLYPIGACRSSQKFICKAMGKYHPAALARALLPEAEAQATLLAMLREARYPARPSAHTKLVEEELISAMKKWKLSVEDPAPARAGSSLGYCPRCRVQFARAEGSCTDCGGVGLLPL